jgi:hypothetical protein
LSSKLHTCFGHEQDLGGNELQSFIEGVWWSNIVHKAQSCEGAHKVRLSNLANSLLWLNKCCTNRKENLFNQLGVSCFANWELKSLEMLNVLRKSLKLEANEEDSQVIILLDKALKLVWFRSTDIFEMLHLLSTSSSSRKGDDQIPMYITDKHSCGF